MADIDYGKVSQLLGIVEKVSNVAPKLVYIQSEAMAALNQMDDDIRLARLDKQNLPLTPNVAEAKAGIPAGGSEADFEAEPKMSRPLTGIPGPDHPEADPASIPDHVDVGDPAPASEQKPADDPKPESGPRSIPDTTPRRL